MQDAVPIHAATVTDTTSRRSEFERDGFIAPVDVLTPAQARLVGRYFDDKAQPKPLRWHKGVAAADHLVYEIATLPHLLQQVVALLGPDVVLWAASVVDRRPGEAHPWHVDIETSAPDACSVTAWIGLENTSAESALNVIPGSHRFGQSLQQTAVDCGIPRDQRGAEQALELARRHTPAPHVASTPLVDGQAMLFDGRIWHGSLNLRNEGRRRALLLQYAAAGTPIQMPDWSQLDPPFRYQPVRVPAMTVAGTAVDSTYEGMPPPARSPDGLPPLPALIRRLPRKIPPGRTRGWRPYDVFKGSTPVLDHLDCHVSVLTPGSRAHPPVAHLDEEVLIVLEGRARIIIATSPDDPAPRTEEFGPGDWIYYPSFQHHTILGIGDVPVTYLMFQWRGLPRPASAERMGLRIVRNSDYSPPELKPKTIRTTPILEGPTALCSVLHAHRSRVNNGGGYEPHVDDHDGAILLTRGSVRVLERTVRAPAVIYYPAGVPHGLRGVGDEPADYLVFEWHREPSAVAPGPRDVAPAQDEQAREERRYRLQRLRTGLECFVPALRP